MRTRIVRDTAYYSDGQKAAGQVVYFRLEGEGSQTSTELILPKEVSDTSDLNGLFEATLWCNEDGLSQTYWRCDLPSGQSIRFTLPYGDGTPVTLLTLLAAALPNAKPADAPTLDDAAWTRLKAAVAEYSMYRPLLVYALLTPTAGQKNQTVPTGAFGVESIDYGERFTLAEVMADQEAEQGWCLHNGVLYLTPAPAAPVTPFVIVWRQAHQPNELTRTFPTLPARDQYIIDWLVEAIETEEAGAAVDLGLTGYTIGGTTIRWGQQGGSGSSASGKASKLRNRALSALADGAAEWA